MDNLHQFGQDYTGRSAPHTPIPLTPQNEETVLTLTPTFEWSAFEDGGNGATQAGYRIVIRCDDDNDKITLSNGTFAVREIDYDCLGD